MAEAKLRATKRQYLPTISAVASAGDFEVFDTDRRERTGAWWAASAGLSLPLLTGFQYDYKIAEVTLAYAIGERN